MQQPSLTGNEEPNEKQLPNSLLKRPTATLEEEPDFWARFEMMTATGQRFSLDVCFKGRNHYNSEMMKLQTANNMHVVLRDANDESIVVKRDTVLYVLPSDHL